MLLNIFTVYDSKAKIYLPTFHFRSKGEALRAFMDSVGDRTHQFHVHAADYTLLCIGTFDDENALIDCFPTHEVLARAIELLPKPEGELTNGTATVSDEPRLFEGANSGNTAE